MYVVVVGMGQVGRHVVTQLERDTDNVEGVTAHEV